MRSGSEQMPPAAEQTHTGKLTDEYPYRIRNLLEAELRASQRRLADQLGISLGGVNCSLRALPEKWPIKANSFLNSANQQAYFYLLTPTGIEGKARFMVRFLRHKLSEYEALKRELEELQIEADRTQARTTDAP
jgi:EPS-associated MarR family transcriptional regulator